MKIPQWVKEVLEKCMTVPDYNSRLVFLLSGIGSVISVVTLVIAFIFSKEKSGYDMMVLAVSGGALGHGVNRYLTKKNGGDDKDKEDKGDSNASS